MRAREIEEKVLKKAGFVLEVEGGTNVEERWVRAEVAVCLQPTGNWQAHVRMPPFVNEYELRVTGSSLLCLSTALERAAELAEEWAAALLRCSEEWDRAGRLVLFARSQGEDGGH